MDFNVFLSKEHMKQYPQLSEDLIPTHFEDWLGNMSSNEWILLGQKYGLERALSSIDNVRTALKKY
jgi:hypothetical protein